VASRGLRLRGYKQRGDQRGENPLGGPTTITHGTHPESPHFLLTLIGPPFYPRRGEEDVEGEDTHHGPVRVGGEEHLSLGPIPNQLAPQPASTPLMKARSLLVGLVQPPELPPQIPESRNLSRGMDTGVGAGAGADVGVGMGMPLEAGAMAREEKGDGETREYRRQVPSQDEDVRRWHILSRRPEHFFPSQLPLLGLNPHMALRCHPEKVHVDQVYLASCQGGYSTSYG
jgi:hypothetical protein